MAQTATKMTEATDSPVPRKSRTAKKAPTQEEIQLRAYEIYLERRGAPGNELEDWVQAERELNEKYQRKPSKPSRTQKTKVA